MVRTVQIGAVKIGGRQPLALLAGPCVIESRRAVVNLAGRLVTMARDQAIPLVFKASYDKANRSALTSFRGPGLRAGLDAFLEIKERYGVPVLTDVHSPAEAEVAASVVDALQIPAFLCRQTDLIVAAAGTGKPVNIKKGQFLAPWDMRHVVAKAEAAGNRRLLLTERGASFGYNQLVVDMRSLLVLREFGYPVVFDATHSVQRPGAGEQGTSGDRQWAPALARAAVATGCDAVFVETHPQPGRAKSDKDNTLRLASLPPLIAALKAIDDVVDRRART